MFNPRTRSLTLKGLAERACVLLAIGLVERTLFTRLGWPRKLAQLVTSRSLARLKPHFDERFYLRQIRSPVRRRRAGRNPLLHYVLLGWREHRAPNLRFDPNYYNAVTSNISLSRDPFEHCLRFAPQEAPQNEAEAERPRFDAGRLPMRAALILHHSRGGGSSRFLALYQEDQLLRSGLRPVRLRAIGGAPRLVVWEDGVTPRQAYDIIADRAEIVRVAKESGLDRILISHVVDMPPQILFWIMETAREIQAPFDVILHDYFAVCPRVNLVDSERRYCAIAPPNACIACLRRAGEAIEPSQALDWRPRFKGFLEQARDVIVPTQEMKARLEPLLGRTLTIWRPEQDAPPPLRRVHVMSDEALRVAILGDLTIAKGSDVVAELAGAAKARKAPLSLSVIGSSPEHARLRKPGVKILGRYRQSELRSLVDQAQPHAVFIPAIWPETWSFVLSHAMALGLPTVAFDFGAPAERLRRIGREHFLLPANWVGRPEQILDFFLALREEWKI